MAKSLSSLRKTETVDPPIIVLYGVDGVGKTTIAAEFPDPVYFNTEGERPPVGVSLATPGTIESFDELLDLLSEVITDDHDRKTVILDSLDGLEALVWKATCKRIGAESIDDNSKDSPASYGRGFREADVEWNDLLSAAAAITRRGIAVVLLAHPGVVKFNSPVNDPYDRYEIKLNKRAAALVREKADVVGFIDYRTSIKKTEVGFKKTTTRGEGGGDRQIHLEERPGFLAKNRYDMPACIQYRRGSGYAELSKYFPAPTGINNAAA